MNIVSKIRRKRSYGFGVMTVGSWVKNLEKQVKQWNSCLYIISALFCRNGCIFSADNCRNCYQTLHFTTLHNFGTLLPKFVYIFGTLPPKIESEPKLDWVARLHHFGSLLPKCVTIFGSLLPKLVSELHDLF